MSRLQDILEEHPMFSVEENQTVCEVARKMASVGIGAILVLKDGLLRGLFSERDLMTRVVVPELSVEATLVSEVMSTELATIEETASVDAALEMMHRNNCRHLPVTRGGEVVGLISMRDLVNFELERRSGDIPYLHCFRTEAF